ncbi:D-alanyl-D-alanine carboxypeptidase family protein [Paenibacillus yanchengensis]|uniref:D-alanyl-D-alanine carboxypeptidase family protein n=1 Tax=Paenibacillus yanchengensis TaxID=2035833 RepID=A0ABW4YK32_9BACL
MNGIITSNRLLRIVVCIIIVSLFTLQIVSLNDVQAATKQYQAEKADKQEVATSAKASALIDVTSGRILHSDNGDSPLLIASLTKIMTAIVAIEHGRLDDQVTVNATAVGKEGSSIYIELDEKITLHHLLYGLMLRSGNDAAVAIAEHVGGSEEGFVHLMNEKAVMLGMKNSSFKNPHGLDEDGHYSSANDLAILTAYALKNKHFAEIVATKVKTVPNTIKDWNYRWTNKNKLLSMYDGADGVKTGYTKKAQRCLVSSATRNEQQLVVVTIAAGDDWNDHQKLLDYGFKNYNLEKLVQKNKPIRGYPYQAGNNFYYPLKAGELEQVQSKVVPFDDVQPFRFGLRGYMQYFLEDELIGSVPLYDYKGVFGY